TISSSPEWSLEVSTAGAALAAGVQLPAGALPTRIEIEGCESGISTQLRARLYTCPVLAASCTALGGTIGADGAGPGCATFSGALAAHTVDNVQNNYVVRAEIRSEERR